MNPVLIITFIFLALFINVSHAKTDACPAAPTAPTQEAMARAMEHAQDHGFLWKVSKGEHVSYLYGTIHLAKFEDMFLGPVTTKAIRQVDTVALELDMLNPEIMQRLVESMTTTKSHEIPEALKTKIKQVAEAECVPYESLSAMTPELQMTTLEILPVRRDGLYTAYAIDSVLAGFGRGANKQVISLETPEMQIALLNMETQQQTIDFVTKSLEAVDSGKVRKMTLNAYQFWRNSDHEKMTHYKDWCECMDTEEDKQFMHRLLNERNLKLAQKIDDLHASGTKVFAAVGSLHMFGEQGLPNLLRQRGYQVERVSFQ